MASNSFKTYLIVVALCISIIQFNLVSSKSLGGNNNEEEALVGESVEDLDLNSSPAGTDADADDLLRKKGTGPNTNADVQGQVLTITAPVGANQATGNQGSQPSIHVPGRR